MENQLILLVEDTADDVFFLRRALKKAQINNPLQVAVHGQEAIDYLAGNGNYGDRTKFPLPALVLLDLKLPFVDGFEVLAWLRTQPCLVTLPVVILTSSSEERDRRRAAELGANGYLVKPPDEAMMREVMQLLAVSRTQQLGAQMEAAALS